MNEQNNGEKPRREHKVLHTVLIVLIIIIAAFWIYRSIIRARLNTRQKAVAAAGYPITCVELDEWYTIPESAENAAETFKDAFSHYQKWEGEEKRNLLPGVGKAQLPLRTEPLTEETKALITHYLADNQQSLELLHKGAAIEHSRYPIDLSKGFESLMPDLSEIRTGARLLELEAVLHAENGKPEEVVDSITSIFGLARSLSKEPVLISQLVRIACQALAVSALEHTINRTEFTDEQLVSLSKTLANAEAPSAMTLAFIGERCAGLSIFKMPSAQIPKVVDGGPSLLAAVPIALYKFSGLADMGSIKYIDLMSSYIETTKLPLHERQKAANAVNAKFEKTSRIHVLLHLIMPALSRVATIDVRSAAQLQTAQAGLAIERYRLAAGKLPDALADLVPAYLDSVPKDPFDGNDLRYKKLETGFVVYSIGEDGNDDDGKEKSRKKSRSRTPEDVTFIIQR